MTTESHIYQVRLTESLVARLQFQKSKNAEIAWVDARIGMRQQVIETDNNEQEDGDNENNAGSMNTNQTNNSQKRKNQEDDDDNENVEMSETKGEQSTEKTLTLESLETDEIPVHNAVLINELKLSDFRQVLMKNNISSEFSGGVLWCCNGTLALRRIDTGKVTIEGCLSEDYYKVRDLLYEQYAFV